MANVYEQVTDRIIAQLEQGSIPWRKEWKSTGGSHIPTNYTTKKTYRGINILLEKLQEAQTAFWNYLGELEQELDIELDGTHDFSGDSVDDLLAEDAQ